MNFTFGETRKVSTKPNFRQTSKRGSPGIVVTRGYSFKGCGFECWRHILEGHKKFIYVTDDRPYMMILDLIRPFRSYMVRPYMV